MTRSARHIAVASIATLAAVVAIIAADITPPANASCPARGISPLEQMWIGGCGAR